MTDTPITSSRTYLTDADGLLWDIYTHNGEIVNGSSDAFDGGFEWSDFFIDDGGAVLTDGREVNLTGSLGYGGMEDLEAARSIYVSDTLGYARFLDTITNTGDTAVTYTYNLYTNLGSDSGTQILDSGNGDQIFTSEDTSLTTDDYSTTRGDPAVTHLFHDATLLPDSVSLVRDALRVSYEVTINPGESLSFLSFGFQNRLASEATAQLAHFDANSDLYLEGLNDQELTQVVNFTFGSGGIATDMADVLFGTNGGDLLRGLGGDDRIRGRDGMDTVDGGAGDDTILAGNGDDLITGAGGADVIYGGDGDDTVLAGTGEDTVYNAAGSDLHDLGGGDDLLHVLDPLMGNDTTEGGLGYDTLDFSALASVVFVDLENGRLTDQQGNSDQITGFEAVIGSDQRSHITASEGNNDIWAHGGDDVVFAREGDDWIDGGAGHDRLFGEDGADTILGDAGNDRILGHDGEDNLEGGDGHDALIGGAGRDLLFGGADDDRLVGQDGADVLRGETGNDRLIGGAGEDYFDGGAGDDILVDDGLATEVDTFVFSADAGHDRVLGYDQGLSVLELDAALWGGDLTARQVVNQFAYINAAETRILLNFGEVSITLVNGDGLDLATLANDISILESTGGF